MRLVIDWTKCTGHGMCAELLPELVEMDEWGYPIVRDPAVPSDMSRHAVAARSVCPALAVRLDPDRQVKSVGVPAGS